MQTSVHDLYQYDHVYQLLFSDTEFCLSKDNAPMNSNSNSLKAHKGIDNSLVFRILSPDRKPVDMCQYQIYGRVTDAENGTIVLEKLARQGSAKGVLYFELNSGDITDIHSGTYNFVLIATQPFVTGQYEVGAIIEKPLFVNFNNDVQMTLTITEQALHDPVPSVIITETDWTGDSFFPMNAPPTFGYYSKAIAGARVLNHRSSVHSFSTYTENFTGVLELFGTLDETPSPYLDSSRWFKLYPSSMSQDIEYIGYTGTQAWTLQCNVMWLKFRLFPSTQVINPGIMKKIIFRA
jgi:hypothetical protein